MIAKVLELGSIDYIAESVEFVIAGHGLLHENVRELTTQLIEKVLSSQVHSQVPAVTVVGNEKGLIGLFKYFWSNGHLK